MNLPKFRNSTEALRFGEKYKGNKDAIRELKGRRQTLLSLFQRRKIERSHYQIKGINIDDITQNMVNIATKTGLYREAIEMATGKISWPKWLKRSRRALNN